MYDVFQPFLKTERHLQFDQLAQKVAQAAAQHRREADEQAQFSDAVLEKMKTEGYTLLTLPEQMGGRGASLYEFLISQERIAQADGAAALSIGWHLGTLMELTEGNTWPEDVFLAFIQEIRAQHKVVNRAASEPATGSPTRGGIPETRAVKKDDGYILNGRKTFTSMANQLDYYLVTAYVEDQEAVGSFLIPGEIKGVSTEHTWNPMGMRGTGSDDLILEEVFVPQSNLVESGKKSGAPKGFLLHIPACYLGIAIGARNRAVEFAKNYQPNSLQTPIAEVPHVKAKIGEMDLALMQARHFMYHVAEMWDSYPDKRMQIGPELAAVKTAATNAASKVVDLAMKIAGGRGLSKQFDFEQSYRDVRAGLHNPPMDDMVLNILADRAVKE